MVTPAARWCSVVLTLLFVLHQGKGHLPQGSAPAAGVQSNHLRLKRCSCNSWSDKECVYFCHLDIIWVNTPGQTTPYGLGNPPRRRRRALSRCECASSRDRICATFCHLPQPRYPTKPKMPSHSEPSATSPLQNTRVDAGSRLLRALRDIAKSRAHLTRWQNTSPGGSRPNLLSQRRKR
ncbi:endothelin-2 [Dromiciops gliroides]|uniref:endothelin-2 n=1 Tax=Dromiciops gliroides TaxID=33562 RepID=UPI001CC563FF|nr:endothelin-2 [Dromiciops gliroides]